ncbi:2'-5' RNA ligase family protein [Pedococcus sp. 5OH_020]|uniref:2'-5' RNA ligase family protein n=1 Tax=Pedococcus sp. 5OH_020 TaxID=2989814 RepID=UPI0022E99AA1|nr:2'-5' RNA ligase family protein [Pedococcus sp. 5OH_020]
MALAVCLLFDRRTDEAIRALWERLEALGTRTLATHTHGRHVPHLSYAVLREYDVAAVADSLDRLPCGEPLSLRFDAVALFRRGRAALVPAATEGLQARQAAVVRACEDSGAELHQHYRPGAWIPHSSLATRVRREELAATAAAAFDILPLEARAPACALIDSSTGQRWPLPRLL